jgi:molybdenum cofactor synthesis domain-containing protein
MFLNIVEEYMFTVGIITSSDKGYSGEREDKSGKVIEEIVSENGFKVIKKVVLPDEKTLLENEMINMCDNLNVNLLLTTGGTGFSKRDITPEATKAVIEREALGIVEAIRFYSLQITKRAMLSRATSGIRKNTLIINLPGSPKACKEALDFVLEDIKHGIEILLGKAKECARK